MNSFRDLLILAEPNSLEFHRCEDILRRNVRLQISQTRQASPCLLHKARPEQVRSFKKKRVTPPGEYAAAGGLQCRIGWQLIAFLMLIDRSMCR